MLRNTLGENWNPLWRSDPANGRKDVPPPDKARNDGQCSNSSVREERRGERACSHSSAPLSLATDARKSDARIGPIDERGDGDVKKIKHSVQLHQFFGNHATRRCVRPATVHHCGWRVRWAVWRCGWTDEAHTSRLGRTAPRTDAWSGTWELRT